MTKKRWQNLYYGKCPNCDSRMSQSNGYLVCPEKNTEDETKSCFFINTEKAAELLIDPGHPANFCLKPRERDNLEEAIQKLKSMV